MSETAAARHILERFCIHPVLDLGFGGSSISPNAINLDYEDRYTTVGNDPQHLTGDARNLYWFKDGVLGSVYSSHLLEDFPPTETVGIVDEWLRVIKPGGNLILLLPDEPVFREHCQKTGQNYNLAHQNHVLTLDWFKKAVVPSFAAVADVVFDESPINIYSFAIVLKKK